MITCHSSAPLGSVAHLPVYEPSSFPSSAVILCRCTAPLVSFAFSLIRRGVGCRVLGKEIGQGLITLVKKLNASDLNDLANRLDMFRTREVEKFRRKGEDQAADNIEDKCQCLHIFISAQPPDGTIQLLCNKISMLFDDSASGLLTLSTIHKSKGLEWPTVFLLDRPKFMPSKYAKTKHAKQQEDNLLYVALTRAKLDLRYINSGCWKPSDKLAPLDRAQLDD